MPGLGDTRLPDPRRWGRARERRPAWLLRAFGAWRWAVVRCTPWSWSLAWYFSWDLDASISWARFVSRTLDLVRLETRVAWILVRIVRGNSPRTLAQV